MRSTTICMCALAFGAATSLPAQVTPISRPTPAPEKQFRPPAIRDVTLTNGMRMSLVPFRATPTATISLVIRTGTRDEDATEVGVADLVGRLLLEGTRMASADSVARLVSALGAVGGDISVNVSSHETSLSVDVLPESAPAMIALFAELVRSPAFSDSALERLKANAVRRLTAQSSQASLLASARANAILFPGNPADRRPTEAGIRELTRNKVVAFHAKYYVPQRAQLYVAGSFDGASVERAARSAFGTWARGAGQSFVLPAGFSGTGRVQEGKPKIHLIDRPGSTQARVQISFPVVDQPHADLSVLNEINMVMGSTQTARIIANVRERHGYSYNVSSRLVRRPGSTQWVVSGDMTNNVVGASIREILSEISRLQEEPPDSSELGGFQSFMAGILVSENSTAQGIIDMLRLLDLYGMSRRYLATFVGSVYEVSGQDIQRVARRYLQPASGVIVVVGDRNAILSQLAEIGTVVN